MLKARIRAHCEAEESCACIILRAAAEEYGFSLPEELLEACGGINGGFGINGMCGALVAAVMVLGLLFDEEELKLKRLLFLLGAQERLGATDCCRLSAKGTDCSGLLEEIAVLLQEVIEGDGQ
ncbi:MAG: C-GCAxxG-C-C family protein [Anaerotignum sp.]|nr:C-GCAxxG-C-C family protein [Anaerotignum sp.]